MAGPSSLVLVTVRGAMLREEGTGARWHIIMAGSMFAVAPVLLVFLVAQRHIIRGFTFATLK